MCWWFLEILTVNPCILVENMFRFIVCHVMFNVVFVEIQVISESLSEMQEKKTLLA